MHGERGLSLPSRSHNPRGWSVKEPPGAGVLRALVLEVLMKSADLSNTAKPFPICRRWAVAVMEEFWGQGVWPGRAGGSSPLATGISAPDFSAACARVFMEILLCCI